MKNLNLQKTQKKNPMAEYLLKLQLIVTNTEFKDTDRAKEHETLESRLNGEKYCHAKNHTDVFETYQYSELYIRQALSELNYASDQIEKMIEDPVMIPSTVKEILKVKAREAFIRNYEEPNPYYVMLSGRPFQGTTTVKPEAVVTIPDGFYEICKNENEISRGMPIHEMPMKYQELFIGSEYYDQVLAENPNHPYLKYIGTNAIPIEVARPLHDGEIMKINTNHMSMTHPVFGNVSVTADMIHLFTNVYGETWKYVYQTLRGDFADIYPNYNSFIRFLTIYMAIGGCMNELMKMSASMIYMNQSTANDFFMLYGLPSVIMEGPSMIKFLKQLRMILMDKGTNIVYRVKDLIGYEYTDIYTLVMVKQQRFVDGKPVYVNGVPQQDIVFRRLGTTADNTSYFKYRDSTVTYPWEEICSGDPRWWNTPETEQMLYDMNYTLSNSKYIQMSTHLSMTDIYWQCVILIRGLLDNRYETQFRNLILNVNMNGTTEMSVFEAVLILEILMNWNVNTVRRSAPDLRGDMYLPNGTYNGVSACLDMLFNGLNPDGSPLPLKEGSPYKISSFNFNLVREDSAFFASMYSMEYLEPAYLMPLLESIYNREDNNVGETLMGDIKKVYDHLEKKLQQSTTIYQFRQVTDAFNHLFLVDPNRNWYSDDGVDVDAYLCETFSLSYQDLSVLKTWFRPEDSDTPPDVTITYTIDGETKDYGVYIYDVMNIDNVTELEINGDYPFTYNEFVELFKEAMWKYSNPEFNVAQVSLTLRSQYQEVIIDKVVLDTGNTSLGPKTFDALLYRLDPKMYRYVTSLRSNPDALLLAMRAIVKALESYVNTSLNGLYLSSLGEENYFDILKQVISYFKSYMVEYTKDELVYIFDGLFDYGGNSNMLKLYDEISHGKTRMIPKDSLTLHDASHAVVNRKEPDYGLKTMYDEMQIHLRAAYKKIKDKGYDIVFDTEYGVTANPTQEPGDDDIVEFSLYNVGTDVSPVYQVRIHL